MSKTCDITGRKTTFGNNVSFSKHRTNRTFKANFHSRRIFVPELDRYVRIKVSTQGLRLIDKHGGLVPALRAQGRTIEELI
jgi:large subunit ribosomal protein L28